LVVESNRRLVLKLLVSSPVPDGDEITSTASENLRKQSDVIIEMPKHYNLLMFYGNVFNEFYRFKKQTGSGSRR
jgi:hypothetical protein